MGYNVQYGMADGTGTGPLNESIFSATNATVGTGIASKAASTGYLATNALMSIHNTATLVQTNNNVWLHPIMLRLWATQANTSAEDSRLVFAMDNIIRRTSGGTQITPVSTSIDTRDGYTQRTPEADIYFGDITTAAASSDEVLLAHPFIKTAIFAASEGVEIWFGADVGAGGMDAADQNINRISVPPMPIGRVCTLLIHFFSTSTPSDDPAFEFEFVYAERGHTTFGS